MGLKIFIADDHSIFRSGLKAFLEKESDFEVVGECGDGNAVIKQIRENNLDVLVLDISMPGPPVNLVIQEVLKMKPDLGIVILTMHEDEFYLREVFHAGVKAFVLKKSTGRELISAIQSAYRNRLFVDPALSSVLLYDYLEPERKRGKKSSLLTRRETQVLKMLVRGYTNEEVAQKLFISKRTVETHRAHIMEKLGMKTRAELVRYALEKGYLKK